MEHAHRNGPRAVRVDGLFRPTDCELTNTGTALGDEAAQRTAEHRSLDVCDAVVAEQLALEILRDEVKHLANAACETFGDDDDEARGAP